MKQIFIIDNFDSFTFNIVRYLKEMGTTVVVRKNNELDFDEIEKFSHILVSPGPGIPSESGQLIETLKYFKESKNIFGVCLGQQAIAEIFGGTLVNLKKVYHGVATTITHLENDIIYTDLPSELEVGRYHSWVVNAALPSPLIATSFDEHKNIMSLKHKTLNIRAVQYHPESVLTPDGKKILMNWINLT